LVSVGKGRHETQVELARRLCAAYVSFRIGRRSIDFVLPHMPEKIGIFWLELARLLTLQRGRSDPGDADRMSAKTRAKRARRRT